ncbi:MAG: hypothetical protein IJQ57_09840, partial [Synergistaceae bacterium]|nr:hypothetical protein [Synergistaceae bacterium]
MAVSFASVTDVKIPQGNVVKIHEAGSGRVLWQKNTSGYNTKTKLNLIKGPATLDEIKTYSGYSPGSPMSVTTITS